MSKHQQVQATRIANVPADQFEAQAEDDQLSRARTGLLQR